MMVVLAYKFCDTNFVNFLWTLDAIEAFEIYAFKKVPTYKMILYYVIRARQKDELYWQRKNFDIQMCSKSALLHIESRLLCLF